jgi:glycosyltransferase involved in cell wall biosynthesis
MKSFLLSVVIPSYNEMTNLRKGVLDKVDHYLSRQKYDYEVIVVDDGSDDGGREFVKAFVKENKKFKLIEGKHTGKAGAVTTGVMAASGDFVLFTDMDQATPIEEVEKLLPFANAGFDIVIGSRSTTRRGSPFARLIVSRSAIILRKLLVGMRSITDTQCGFKLFNKKSAQGVFSKINSIHHGYSKSIKSSSVTAGFDIELLYIGRKLGYKIKEVPVDWLYVETRRVSPIKDSIEGFADLLKIKRNILKGVYD